MKKLNFSRPVLNKLLSLFVALSLLTGIFLFTNPNQVSLAVLLIPFLLIGYLAYMVVAIAINMRSNSNEGSALFKLIPLSIAFLVVALLLLASLGQLTVRDSLLVTGFTVFFLLYIARADFLK
jgi:hypothetical protein